MNDMDSELAAERPMTLEDENRRLKELLGRALTELDAISKKHLALLEADTEEGRKMDELLTNYRSTMEEMEMRLQMAVGQRDDAIAEVVRLRRLLKEDGVGED